jgi:hypothetical protein
MSIAATPKALHLLWSEKERKALIETEDEDRFFFTVEDVIEACRVYDKQAKRTLHVQMKRLLTHLGQWAEDHKASLQKVLLTVRDEHLLFLVVTKAKTYDASLENALTELDLSIAHNEALSDVRLTVQSLPDCDKQGFESFCQAGTILEYEGLHAKRSGPCKIGPA